MKVFSNSNTFYLDAPSDDPVPRDLGWKWLSGKRVWMTAKMERVIPVRHLADTPTATKIDSWVKEREAAIAASIASTSDIIIPAPPGKAYRPYQKAGTAFMLGRPISLNADVPRLGKTIQTLAVANYYKRPLKILVLCPAVAKKNWCREADAWLIDKTTVGYCEGSKWPATDFVVCNYDIVTRHIDMMQTVEWDIVVFDEAHFLKNPKAQRTKASLQLRGKLHTIFLTGTPAFTRPLDMWPIIEVCDPDRLGRNWMSYVRRYCDAHRNGFAWDTSGSSNEEELQFKMRSSFMVRRTKSDVMREIPPTRRTVLLSRQGFDIILKRERDAIHANLRQLLDMLALEDDADLEAFAEYDGRLEDNSPIATVRRELALAKVPQVVAHCQEILETEEKLVVFGHHRDVVKAVAEALDAACVIGGMTTNQRDAQIQAFKEGDKRVIVGNMTSMGTAISLKEADYVVFAELSWIPSEIDQAEERVWDVTKDSPVSIDRLVIEDSLEYQISCVLERRQESIDRLMSAKYLRHFD